MKLRLAFGLALLMTQSGCFLSTTDSPFLRLESDAATQFNHRGMVRNERPVLQSALDLELQTQIEGWVNLGLWTNLDVRDETGDSWYSDGQAGRFTQIDALGSYSEAYRGLDWTFGLASDNPQRGPSFPFANRKASAEAFLVVSKELGLVHPRVELHWDFDEADGGYFLAGASHALELTETLALTADLSAAYSDANHSSWIYGTGHSGLADLSGSLTGTWAFDPRTTFRARLSGSTILDDDIAAGVESYGIDTDNVWVSVGVEWTH